MFHHYFFTLDPDEKVIKANMLKALYLADQTAQQVNQDLEEKGYYNNVISANISQQVSIDSISLSMDSYPYSFRCVAKQKIIRSSSIVTRSLITQGQIRNVSRSDNNPHGFLIEHWSILDNHDLSTEARTL
jgi:conjugative transposon TraK protein